MVYQIIPWVSNNGFTMDLYISISRIFTSYNRLNTKNFSTICSDQPLWLARHLFTDYSTIVFLGSFALSASFEADIVSDSSAFNSLVIWRMISGMLSSYLSYSYTNWIHPIMIYFHFLERTFPAFILPIRSKVSVYHPVRFSLNFFYSLIMRFLVRNLLG